MSETSQLRKRAVRCPYCLGTDVRESRRRNLVERVLLAVLMLRRYRCLACCGRFYRAAWRG